jgi:coenzyme F420-0:L-glutamate ligase / coenzyme F420-1:gamma-L-glutamate ligase
LKQIIFSALEGFPLIHPGDDLAGLIFQSLKDNKVQIVDGDILVLAQKIVSKAEGRYKNLSQVQPGKPALELGKITGKDPRFIELVLGDSKSILRAKNNTLIVEHRLGFVCANAGIDHSNVDGEGANAEDWVLMLPENPDRSARLIRNSLEEKTGHKLGVVIIDSHGRAWRMGIAGVAIGFSGVPGLVDMRGHKDLFGYELKVTQIAAVDELAASASLLMGQADESLPVIHVHGFPYPLRESRLNELIRPIEQDLFR